MRVDLHTHFLPPEFFDLLDTADAARTLESFSVFGPMLRVGAQRQYADGVDAVLEDWQRQMDAAGFDIAVVSLGALQPYFADEHSAVTVARRANVMLLDAVERSAGRLAAFGSVPLPHATAAVAEVEFVLDDLGFAGINLGTSATGLPLDAPQFDDMWAALDQRHATVFLHPGTTPLMGAGSAEFHLAPDFCSPTETALALCRLVAGRVTLRHPDVRVVAAAFGGALPFFAHRFDAGMRRSHPELYEELGGMLPQFRRFWYDTSMIEEPGVFDAVRASVGIDRLVFGSDLPRGPLADVVDFVSSSDRLTQTEKALLLERGDQVVRAPGATPVRTQ